MTEDEQQIYVDPQASKGELRDVIGSIERAMQKLESDRMTLALRLYGEDPDTFAPETAAVMDRMRPKIEALLREGAALTCPPEPE